MPVTMSALRSGTFARPRMTSWLFFEKLRMASAVTRPRSVAKNAAVTGEEKIVLNARDKAAVGEAVVKAANEALGGGRLTLAEETGDFAGGLILRRENIEVNCTAELLVKVCRDEMSAKMADVLFA